MPEDAKPAPAADAKSQARDVPVVDARDLFRDSREIVILHAGESYKLRITRRGKLILQK